jgi:hypothetical protein
MSSPDSALKGFYARSSTDATLKTVLGLKTGRDAADVHEGFPPDTLQQSDLPRMTYFNVVPSTRRPGVYSVLIQVDGWFPPPSVPGSAAKREQWMVRMLELFDEKNWIYDDEARLYSVVTNPGRDFPAGAQDNMRRMMELRIEVSPF